MFNVHEIILKISKFIRFESANNTKDSHEAQWAYKIGLNDFKAKLYESALNNFDVAINQGYKKDIYELRGICLQNLEYHYDAINDFDKAIILNSIDCNLYFLRSNSKGRVLLFEEQISDIKKAIELCDLKNPRNMQYSEAAKTLGYDSIKKLYEASLVSPEYWLEKERRDSEKYSDLNSFEKEKIERNKQAWRDAILRDVKPFRRF